MKFSEIEHERLAGTLWERIAAIPVPEPSEALLQAAREVAIAYQRPQPFLARENVDFELSATEQTQGKARLVAPNENWWVDLERNGELWAVLFECKPSERSNYIGRYVEVHIDDEVWQLGNVDQQGKAKYDVPIQNDLALTIHIGPKMNAPVVNAANEQNHTELLGACN